MPFPDNTPTPDDLPFLSVPEIAKLPVDLLAMLQRQIDDRIKCDKATKAHFDAALAMRYKMRAADERHVSGRDTGTVRFDDGDFTVVANLPKRVDWDQDRLADIVARIRDAGEDPAEYVDLVYKVAERKYTAWPEAIRQSFEPARTVRTGTLKVEILAQEDSQ